jgi:glycosyltransferase involved in cell wall biosynthesis
MRESLVSIIIPTYNRAGVICRTVDNVLAQTYLNTEIIVVDDGSTDNTQELLRAYGNRIQVITQANAGPSAARNRGFEISHGEIIAFQDSDDLWNPAKLARQVALLGRFDKSVPCCLCNAVLRNVYGDGKEHLSFDLSLMHPPYEEGLWLNVTEVLADRFVLFNQTAAIRRDAIKKVGGFDTNLRYLEDLDLSLKLSLEGPWAYIREPLTIWAGGGSDSLARQGTKDAVGLKEYELEIFNRALSRVKATGGNANLRRRLDRRVRGFRAGLRRIKLCQSSSSIARATGTIAGLFDQYYRAAWRKSPWFPKMLAVPAGNSVTSR